MNTGVKIYTVPLKRKQLSGTCSAVIMLRHPKIIIAYMVGSAVQIDTDGVCNVAGSIHSNEVPPDPQRHHVITMTQID